MVELHFEQLPALLPCYLRALVSGRTTSGIAIEAIPDLRATVDNLVADSQRLTRFRELIGHPDDGLLPPTFPQALAAPLQLSILTAREFRLPITGLVHLSNTIHCAEAIGANQKLELAASVTTPVSTRRGIEITLETTVCVGGHRHWSASSLLLARPAGGRQRQRRGSAPGPPIATTEVDRWRADRNVGRRYAAVSGDYNPIHLHGLSARVLGFRAPVAHGMWSLARSLAGLPKPLQPPYAIQAEFLRPMFLPSEVRLLYSDENPARFSVVDNATNKAYLTASIA